MNNQLVQVILTQDKITKGAVRYSGPDGLQIYLRKEKLTLPYPEQVRMTVEVVANGQ